MANFSFLKSSPWATARSIWNSSAPTIPAPTGPTVAPTPYVKGMPVIQQPAGTPQVPYNQLQQTADSTNRLFTDPNYSGLSGIGARVAGSGVEASVDTAGSVMGDNTMFSPVDPSAYYYGGGGGGSYGGYATLAEQTKSQQQQLADQEKGNITARRDALVGDIGGGYTDQMSYLDSQTQGVNNNAQLGRERITQQKEGTINKAMQDAETAARMARDTYKDMIVQGRRRARATGGGSSSGYLEMSTMLDSQLMRGLGQVEQTKQGQVGAANSIADQAVGEIENTLQQVLGEIANNRAISLRERDSKVNEAKLNAADALLEVDKWLAQTFSDIETAKLSLKTGGGGGSRASFDKTGYQAAQQQSQAQMISDFNDRFYSSQSKGYGNNYGEKLFSNLAAGLISNGATPSQVNSLRGMYFGNSKPDPFTLWTEQNPEASLDEWFSLSRGY